MEKEFTMNVQIDKECSVIVMLLRFILCILIILFIPRNSEIKKEVDISIMGEEIPTKIVSLNLNLSTRENPEIAYILGDRGNIYVLCCDLGNYYVELWHPEFWKNIKVIDLESTYLYIMALDEEGNVYIWDKEYDSKELVWDKKSDWYIQWMANIPEVAEIFAGYYQFVLVTKAGEIYSWNPADNKKLGMDSMEMIEIESAILNIVSLKEELLILDQNNILWSIENGTLTVLAKNVKEIVQSGKGFVVQIMDNKNVVYVYNSYLLQKGYETVTFANKYKVSKVTFESEISLVAVSNKTAVVRSDKEKIYKWGNKESGHKNISVPGLIVYRRPVKVNVKGTKYYMLIGKDSVYVDNQNRMFVVIPY